MLDGEPDGHRGAGLGLGRVGFDVRERGATDGDEPERDGGGEQDETAEHGARSVRRVPQIAAAGTSVDCW